jgi:hypothetical protein
MTISNGAYHLQPHIASQLDKLLSKKMVQQFLGIINYMAEFIPKVAAYTDKFFPQLPMMEKGFFRQMPVTSCGQYCMKRRMEEVVVPVRVWLVASIRFVKLV